MPFSRDGSSKGAKVTLKRGADVFEGLRFRDLAAWSGCFLKIFKHDGLQVYFPDWTLARSSDVIAFVEL
jgi:hypothetical protein